MAFAVDLTGSILDRRYRITGLLGKGGMGHVYDAVHIALGQRVAVKVLHPRYAYEERFRERFLQEARAASMIKHPNVVEIKDSGETPDGSVYFSMEYLRGHDVGVELQRHGKLPWARTRSILVQAASALHAAHTKHIIHRDIKPGNCFLLEDEANGLVDVVKLLDFGIAKVGSDSYADAQGKGLTGTGEVFGTASYMSPEQARGEVLDARSDMYSLGIMAYEMLVGQVPFTGVNAIHVITQHMRDRPEPLRTYDATIPEAVEALVLKMLAKEPRDRYASMAEVEQALREIPEDAGVRKTRMWSSPGEVRAMIAAKQAGTTARPGGPVVGPARAASASPVKLETDAERTGVVVPKVQRAAVKRTVPRTARSEDPAPVASAMTGPTIQQRAPVRAATPTPPAVARAPALAAAPGTGSPGGVVATPSTAALADGAVVPPSTKPSPAAVASPPADASPVTAAEPAGATVVVMPVQVAVPAGHGAAASAPSFEASASSSAGGPPGWPMPVRADGTNPPPGRDVSASWPPSTASTGPHLRLGDTGTETRPHALEVARAPGASARAVLVVGLLFVLVSGVSVVATMAFLSRRNQAAPVGGEAGGQPKAAEGAMPAAGAADRSERASEGEALGREEGAAGVVRDDGAPSSVLGPEMEMEMKEGVAVEAAVGETGEGETPAQSDVDVELPAEDRSEGASRPAQPAATPPKHETEKCVRARAAASLALAPGKWGNAAKLAKQRECWSEAEQGERRRILVHALLELARFEECVAAGSKAKDAATRKRVEICRREAAK